MRLRRSCLYVSLAWMLLAGWATRVLANPATPFITNYSKREYHAANQNWSVAQAPNGILYFANSEGLLEFDGSEWTLRELPKGTIVRSVAIDERGRIYTGSYQEFGYWEEDAQGVFTYTSLSDLLGDYPFSNEEIWKIIVDGDRVYFQAFSNKLFLYQKGKVRDLKTPDVTLYSFRVNDQIIVQGLNKGLYILKDGEFSFWRGSELFAGVPVLTILPFPGDRLLIGTATRGLYLYDGTSFTPWDTPASGFLRNYQLNNGIRAHSGYLFGTIQNGVILMDDQGHIVRHLNRESGLQNNAVLSLFEDRQRSLWLGLDNGIDYVEMSEQFDYYRDGPGLLGSLYDAEYFGDWLYLGTNHGLFRRRKDSESQTPFTFVAGSHGQVWTLDVLDGQLICGHNEGTFRVDEGDGNLRKISKVTGGWVQRRVPGKPDLFVQGTYTGLVVFRKVQGRWEYSHRIAGFSQPARYIEFDHEGAIWVSRAYEGVYRIRLTDDLREARKIDYFDSASGFPSDFNINVFRIGSQLVFATGTRLYTYDELKGRIVPFTRLNEDLGILQEAHRILPAGRNKYWFISSRVIGLITLEDYRVQKLLHVPFSRFLSQMVFEYQNIVLLNDTSYLFCLDDGFAILRDTSLHGDGSKPPPGVFIRSVTQLSDSIRLLPFRTADAPKVRYNKSNLIIRFASPSYGYPDRKFQVKLEGFDQQWSEPSSLNYKEYTNLPSGTYTFRVRVAGQRDRAGEQDAFVFQVLPPWYASWPAGLVYLIALVFLVAFFRRRYRQKIQRKHEEAMQRLRHEKEEQLKEERYLNQQRVVELENEKLQAEIAAKSNELANSTMAIIKKNEVLIAIKEKLSHLEKQQGNGLSTTDFHKLRRIIDANISNDDDWRIFEQSFNRAHEDFFRELKHRHPELTPNDLRLCAYLKMNISSKEIAPLLNISVRGVEIRRYRLRKKLNLEHDDNLVEYMMAL